MFWDFRSLMELKRFHLEILNVLNNLFWPKYKISGLLRFRPFLQSHKGALYQSVFGTQVAVTDIRKELYRNFWQALGHSWLDDDLRPVTWHEWIGALSRRLAKCSARTKTLWINCMNVDLRILGVRNCKTVAPNKLQRKSRGSVNESQRLIIGLSCLRTLW